MSDELFQRIVDSGMACPVFRIVIVFIILYIASTFPKRRIK